MDERGDQGERHQHHHQPRRSGPRASERAGTWKSPASDGTEDRPQHVGGHTKHHYRPATDQQDPTRGHQPPPRSVGGGGRGAGGRPGSGRGRDGFNGGVAERSGSPAGRPLRREQGGPAKSLQPTGQREKGFVSSLRDSYGFISSAERSGEVFFHISEVQKTEDQAGLMADMGSLLSLGSEVEFIVQPNPRNDRPNAKGIVLLPAGTIKMQQVGTQVMIGTVVKECQASSRRGGGKDNSFGLLRVGSPADEKPAGGDQSEAAEGAEVSEPTGAATAEEAAPPAAAAGETLMFEAGDIVPGGLSPVTGSQVKFLISTHIRSKQKRAVQVEVTSLPPTPASKPGPAARQRAGAAEGSAEERDMGVVVTAKESFGFIRPVNQEKPEVFFHYSELSEGVRVRVGSAVSFKMQFSQKTKRDVGVNVVLLEDGALPLCPPQTMKGIVNIPSKGSTGMLLFRDAQFFEQTCSYTDTDVEPLPEGDDEPLRADDEVQFDAHLNLQTLNYSASKVKLLRRASGTIEFGQINLIKGSFGFIKCCVRPTDVFFHLSSLEGGLDAQSIAVGENVQFRVVIDKVTGKQNAVDVSPAPEGAVVFEKVEEAELHGHVAERSFAKGAMGTGGMAGVIQYREAEGGPEQRITFLAADVTGSNPKPGDPVAFKIATNLRAAADALRSPNPRMAAHGARHAVEVTVIRHRGKVAALVGSFGFIEYLPVPINVQVHPSPTLPLNADSKSPAPSGTNKVAAPDGTTATPTESGKEPCEASRAPGLPSPPIEADPTADGEAGGKQDSTVPAGRAEGQPDTAATSTVASSAESAAHCVMEEHKDKMEEGLMAEGQPEAPTGTANNIGQAAVGGDGSAEAAQPDCANGESSENETATTPQDPAESGAPGASAVIEGTAAPVESAQGKKGGEGKVALRRIFFHSSEVADNIVLSMGDEVEFAVVFNHKAKELNARHVVRTKEAPHRPLKYKPRSDEEASPAPPVRTTPTVKRPPVHHPVMPDNTRGFTFGRGKGLEGIEHPPLGLRPPPPPEPEPQAPPAPKVRPRTKKPKPHALHAEAEADSSATPGHKVERSSSSQLNVEAPPFVPSGL